MMKKIALLLPIIAGACWGCMGLFIRTLYAEGFDNITITFSRLVVTVVMLAIYMAIFDRDAFRISKRDFGLVAFAGFVGFFLLNMCFNISMNSLSMSLAAVLLCTSPVYVIVLGTIFFKEKITKTKIICMTAALFGCALLSGILDGGGIQWSLFGLAMGIGSAIFNAIYTVASNEATNNRKCTAITILFYATLVAVVFMLPFTDYALIGEYLQEEPLYHGMFYFAHSFVTSLLPNLVFIIALKLVDSGVVAILAAGAEPTTAMILGMLVYKEIPTFWGLLGMIITIGAMIKLTRSSE